MGYGNFTHGEAVMIGMVYALKLSSDLLGLTFNLAEFTHWVRNLGYQTNIPLQASNERLLEKMKQDKKSIGEAIHFVLLEQVGVPVLKQISNEILIEKLKDFRQLGGE